MTAGSGHPRLLDELRAALRSKTIVLVAGVLALQLGFIFSYVAAFHDPKPHRVPIAIVAPGAVAPRVVSEIDAIPGDVARARALPSRAAARRGILSGALSAAIVLDPSGRTDRLLYASGGGEAVATTVQQLAARIERRYGRRLVATDLVPLQQGDGRGLTGFYLVIGWIIGGYLMASLLGMANGTRPTDARASCLRLLGLIPYAVVSGLGGVLIVDQLLGALTGHLIALWWLGVLVVLAAAAATVAFQVLFGIAGVGIVILAFVILGNPSAGGAYQPALLPGFWRAISGWLPNGAGTDSVRRIVYFHSRGIGGHLALLAAYVAIGAAVSILVTHLLRERGQLNRSSP
ncbi:MAG TPA: hypothetical protein VL977_00690 [Solirubrobacteraceae bacterium]|nr:hypothetical protein [Solirubrobacteraceae bacterium]